MCVRGASVVEDNVEEETVHPQAAVIVDEVLLPEFVHKVADPGSCCTDHFRQGLLTNLWNHTLRPLGSEPRSDVNFVLGGGRRGTLRRLQPG